MKSFNNSLATSTSIRWGSNKLQNTLYLAQSINIPGLSFNNPTIGSRGGALARLSSDTVEFSTLNLDIIIDKDWKVYDEIFNTFLETINIKENKFSNNITFDIWVEIYDELSKKTRQKFWFRNCRLQSIGDIEMDIRDSEDTNISCLLTLEFDYMERN